MVSYKALKSWAHLLSSERSATSQLFVIIGGRVVGSTSDWIENVSDDLNIDM